MWQLATRSVYICEFFDVGFAVNSLPRTYIMNNEYAISCNTDV